MFHRELPENTICRSTICRYCVFLAAISRLTRSASEEEIGPHSSSSLALRVGIGLRPTVSVSPKVRASSGLMPWIRNAYAFGYGLNEFATKPGEVRLIQ